MIWYYIGTTNFYLILLYFLCVINNLLFFSVL
nr:MAG TPA: hypothetical protein [Caudoviricetes sp.]